MNTASRQLVIVAFLVVLTIVILVAGQHPTTYAAPSTPPVERMEVKGVSMVYAGTSTSQELAGRPVGSLMFEGFEGTWPAAGWTLLDVSTWDGGHYVFGKRNCYPYKGSYAGWSVGGGANGSLLACEATYPNDVDTWAAYGPFDLSAANSASLAFRMWGKSEYIDDCGYDNFYVGSSVDGINFLGNLYCGDWTGGSEVNGYHPAQLDLSNRLGQNAVWIGFKFHSDGATTDIGITVDDIQLLTSDRPLATSTPTMTATATQTRTATPTLGPLPYRDYLPAAIRLSNPAITPIPSVTPSATATPSPTGPTSTSTVTQTPTATGSPTNTPTVTYTPTSTSTPTVTYTPTATGSPTNTATATRTPTVTNTPTVTHTPTPTRTPTATPRPTNTPTRVPCCKCCTPGVSKPCGDTCISDSYTCHQPPGCACFCDAAFASGNSPRHSIMGAFDYAWMWVNSRGQRN
jgi:hypothetical protein